MRLRRLVVVGALGLVVAGADLVTPRLRAHLQSPPAGPIAFDVVSIKPAVPPPTSPGGIPLALAGAFQFNGGRFRALATTAKALISVAFARKPPRIVGAPDWIETSQFKIIATTADGTLTEATLRPHLPALLRSVLEDRFSLKAHVERRPFPVCS